MTKKNPADLLTKVLFGEKLRALVRMILYDFYDWAKRGVSNRGDFEVADLSRRW